MAMARRKPKIGELWVSQLRLVRSAFWCERANWHRARGYKSVWCRKICDACNAKQPSVLVWDSDEYIRGHEPPHYPVPALPSYWLNRVGRQVIGWDTTGFLGYWYT